MILTIGMIVKNEEKYLERCLNGIKPILEQVDSELIIADTGSTDRTVEIARRFTDNVFYFEWIKDFAAARNSTLEKAQGEWYMFVDADEIFESCDEIIRFFNSGEYKKYNSASYIVRNLLGIDGEARYSDFKAVRMTRILPETEFINPIHECFNTSGFPIKDLNNHVIHYGYNAETEEEKKKKCDRNIEILISCYNNNERSGLLFSQLYDSLARFEPEKADKFLDEGIEYSVKNKESILPILYAKKAVTLYSDKKAYEEVLDICKEYFNMPRDIRPQKIATDIDIIAVEALAYTKLYRYNEALKKYTYFFELYNEYSKGKLRTREQYYSSFSLAREDNFLSILHNFVFSCFELNRYELAAEYMKKLPIYKYSLNIDAVTVSVYQAIELLKHLEYKEINKFYKKFDDKGKSIFRNILFKNIFRSNNITAIVEFFETEEDCAAMSRPARLIGEAAEYRRNGDYKNCIMKLRAILEQNPELAAMVNDYYNDTIKEYEASKPQNEMQRLSAMIKSNIRNYIISKNFDAAAKTLAEYEKINPTDPEIQVLKGEIG